MGDRCFLSVTIRACDEEKFVTILKKGHDRTIEVADEFHEVARDDDGTITCIDFEANYARYDERLEWAKELDFYGHHSAGGNYGPYLFVAWRGDLIECPSHNDRPVVAVDPDTGDIKLSEMVSLWKFFNACKAFNSLTNVPQEKEREGNAEANMLNPQQ